MSKRLFLRGTYFFIFLGSMLFGLVGWNAYAQNGIVENETISGSFIRSITDVPLAPFQVTLLDLAFDTATLIPVNPHIKDRSKLQEEVVATCFKLDQPRRALDYMEKIDNWRRGSCYADFACYCVQQGIKEGLQPFLDAAERISETTEDWRKDRIRIKMAKTYLLLGDNEKAEIYSKDVVDSELGKTVGIRISLNSEISLDELMTSLDALIALDRYEVLKNTLESCTQLYDRFYRDEKKRAGIETTIRSSWNKLPVFLRIELLMSMSRFALDHSDRCQALALVNEAQQMMGMCQWQIEHRISIMAKLAGLRFQSDDRQNARNDANRMLALYHEHASSIVNIDRADVLRSLAETYQVLGDSMTSLSVYRQVIEEGMINPNSRPRAEDLSTTCCSMAILAVEPDSQLWTRIHQIREGLGQPW